MHRTQDTYPLTHFRQHTGEHLERIRAGAIETITQNGEAALIVMSPERYDFLVLAAERGQIWREGLSRVEAGHEGMDAREAIRRVAAELGLTL